MSRDLDKNRTAPVESEYKTNMKTEFEPVIVKKKGINFTQKLIIFLMMVILERSLIMVAPMRRHNIWTLNHQPTKP